MKNIKIRLCLLCIGLLLCGCSNGNREAYETAKELYSAGKYQEAYDKFTSLGEYEDAKSLALECAYHLAQDKINAEAYDEAIHILHGLGDYKDSKDLIAQCEYFKVVSMIDQAKYDEARNAIEQLKDKIDVTELTKQCDYAEGVSLLNQGDYTAATDKLLPLCGYLDTDTYLVKVATKLVSQKNYDKAKAICEKLTGNDKITKLENKIAYAEKYAKFKRGVGVEEESDLDFSYSAKETEEFLKKNVYGTWKEYNTGDSYKIGKYKRGGKAYGIYSACRLTGWTYIYYYYKDAPDKIYVEAWGEVSVPGGESQPFLESRDIPGYKNGDYVYAKMTEEEMLEYADSVQESDQDASDQQNESEEDSSSSSASEDKSNLGIDEEAMFSFAREYIGDAIQDTFQAGLTWEYKSDVNIISAYGGDSVYRVCFRVYFPAKHSTKFVYVYLRKDYMTGNYVYWKGGNN